MFPIFIQRTSNTISAILNHKYWSQASTSYIYDAIKKISYCHLSGTRFETALYDDILKACNDKLPKLTDDELKSLMRHMCTMYFDINKSYYWKQFLGTLNQQCLKRFFPSKIEEMLLICDGFYQLADSTSYYQWRALRKLGSKINNLSAKHLVQFLFLMNCSQSSNFSVNMFAVECRAKECISDLSANEIGILARGFFMKKRKIINHDLMKEMIVRVTKNVKFMESNTLAALMKLIRYTGCRYCMAEFQELLNSLNSEIPRLPLKCLTHIAHAFGGIRVYNEPLTTQIVERAKKEIKDARVKDIERILFAIYSVAPYNDYYQEACHMLMNEIFETYQTVRLTEIQAHPISLVRVLTYAISRNIHIPQLIQYVLNPKYVHNLHQGNMILVTSDMLTLECSVKIEVPDYKGPFLTKAMYDYLIKEYLCKNNIRRKWSNVTFQTDITYICKQFVGIDVYIDYILPHYPVKDVIFGFDEHNNPVAIEPILSSMPTGSIKYVNTANLKNIKWNVLHPLSVDQKLHGRDDYVGSVKRKLKQLQAIGYTPIVIDEVEWNSLTEDKEKEDYLRNRIYENLS
ncbi:FAST kinase domain-containing protein 5, mitochondrial isoform X2 [Megachile rotundata]|uniref:FAST kinase domain-containing protein 5, mitochondrial isoform X2 n=1 Tax=Megachile rotundata TaxID=143995 RepID=UPI000614CA6E|nr:PREDICTED: uncharacterized protein LOC100874953 isoform X2 [Megachile rotundata]